MRDEVRARRDDFLKNARCGPVVIGILNLTPDSFSDGGRFQEPDAAVAHAQEMVAEGAAVVDVGAESTRPGATPISEAEELARLGRVLGELARTLPAALSIDTYKAKVAGEAAAMGAAIVNDVGGLQRDPAMAEVVAERELALIMMHSRREKDAAVDILDDMRRFFDRALATAESAGIARGHIVLDPGIGFGKTSQQNRDALARLGELKPYGCPIMVGVSRKAFLGSLVDRRLETTSSGVLAANLAAAAAGATVFRVHDVAAHVMALKVFQAIRAAAEPGIRRDHR